MVSDHGARAEPIRQGRELRAEAKFELPKLRGVPADWQVKPHCRPSEVANGPWADAAGSMRRGWPRPGGSRR